MSLSIASVLQAVNFDLKAHQGSTNKAFSDEEIQQCLARAIEEYSRNRPRKVLDDFDLIADQQSYSWPDAAIDISPVLFSAEDQTLPLYASVSLDNDTQYNLYQHVALNSFESPASLTRFEIFQARFMDESLGKMMVDKNQKLLILFPIPSKTETVKLLYDSFHTLNDSGEAYDTVLEKDKASVILLTESYLLESLAQAHALQSDKAGIRDNRGLQRAEFYNQLAKEKRKSFQKKIIKPIADRS
jgi:hypothetical protein